MLLRRWRVCVEDYMEVCYGGDMNNTQIDPDELEEGELERFKACILNLKDENVLFVKLGSYLVNLPHVLEIRFCEEEVEVYYDDDETRAIDKKDIEPNALKELNEHLLA